MPTQFSFANSSLIHRQNPPSRRSPAPPSATHLEKERFILSIQRTMTFLARHGAIGEARLVKVALAEPMHLTFEFENRRRATAEIPVDWVIAPAPDHRRREQVIQLLESTKAKIAAAALPRSGYRISLDD